MSSKSLKYKYQLKFHTLAMNNLNTEMKKSISFTIASLKYLEINFTKDTCILKIIKHYLKKLKKT